MSEKINWIPEKIPPLPPDINSPRKPEPPRPTIDIEPPPTKDGENAPPSPPAEKDEERGVWTTNI